MFYRRIWSIVGKYSILCCDSIAILGAGVRECSACMQIGQIFCLVFRRRILVTKFLVLRSAR
jgi:hypothetical protein